MVATSAHSSGTWEKHRRPLSNPVTPQLDKFPRARDGQNNQPPSLPCARSAVSTAILLSLAQRLGKKEGGKLNPINSAAIPGRNIGFNVGYEAPEGNTSNVSFADACDIVSESGEVIPTKDELRPAIISSL